MGLVRNAESRASLGQNLHFIGSQVIPVYTQAGKALDSLVLKKKTNPKVLVTQSCLTLYNTMDYSLPGSSVHGLLQERILEWAAVPSSRGSSQPRDRTSVSYIASEFFTI